MTALADLLAGFRAAAVTEREKGTYFEDLILAYLRHEASYRDLYSDVWTFTDWAKVQAKVGKDIGIDLVAKTRDTDEFHAIQCKFYTPDYKVQKSDIDSFFTASGQKPFVRRLIVSTTDHWSDNAEAALQGQHIPAEKVLYLGMKRELLLMSREPDRERFRMRAVESFKWRIRYRAFEMFALEHAESDNTSVPGPPASMT